MGTLVGWWVVRLIVALLCSPRGSSSLDPKSPSRPIALPECKDECGGIKIPYPFGIGSNCSKDEWFQIICNTSFNPPKPFLEKLKLEVTDIWHRRYQDPVQRYLVSSQKITVLSQKITVVSPVESIFGSNGRRRRSIELKGSPYLYSRKENVLMVENCGGSVVVKNRSGVILGGCASFCDNHQLLPAADGCYGLGCCQASIISKDDDDDYTDKGLDYYEIELHHQDDNYSSSNHLAAGLIFRDNISLQNYSSISKLPSFRTVLLWSATFLPPISFHEGAFDDRYCHHNPADTDNMSWCSCNDGYEGNPYINHGCQVGPQSRTCGHHCNGNYCCGKNQWLQQSFIVGFCIEIGMGLVILILACYWLYRLIKWRKLMRKRAKNFKRNGGLLLQQQMSADEGFVEKTKVFHITELENATDNFNENMIIGKGGQGTVYKGMLTDGSMVAIKKSKELDATQLEQFINEVVILSQINHRNVVKLLGCCLETEVPLLVYEFISNGTLYQHIHDPTEDFHLTWKMRLQVAAEAAGALAYLHSSSSAPIYHRDIKSSNILLDDKYRAKVADFATSRAITIEQTHVTTCILGTYGYLDPEYFQSNQFTEKSDVYSFGVVLVELITGKKPICSTESGGWINLAMEFMSQMDNCVLFDILDARIIEEGKEEEFIVVANLAKQCLNRTGKQRPTMKEAALLLDEIRSAHMPNFKKVPIFMETQV